MSEKRQVIEATMGQAFPLRRTIEPCPACNHAVLMRIWSHGTKLSPETWRETVALHPVTGTLHKCQTSIS